MKGYERLVSLIGETAAETLCWHRGGRGVYIPNGESGVLVRLIGLPATKALHAEFGSGTLLVPLGPISARRQARQRAVELLNTGASIDDAARQTGLHPSTVRRLKA